MVVAGLSLLPHSNEVLGLSPAFSVWVLCDFLPQSKDIDGLA